MTITGERAALWDLAEGDVGEDTEYHSPPDMPYATRIDSGSILSSEGSIEAASTSTDAKLRVRHTRQQRRRLVSPMPSSSNLYTPLSPRASMSGHHLTTAILQRTCSLLLGPPVHLVALMLRIAAKITNGVFQGSAYGVNSEGQHIPCSWEFSDGSGDDEDEPQSDFEEEDDFGFSVTALSSTRPSRRQERGGSWELD